MRNGGKYKLLWRLQKLEHELIFFKKTVGHDSTSFNSISAEEQLFQLASRFTHAHTLLTSSLFSKRLCFLIFCRCMELNGKLLHILIISYHVFTGVDVVLYSVEGQAVAVGYMEYDRQFLHGKCIPSGYKVVRLTWVKSSDIPAPLVLGDPDENFLSFGQFFALPMASLKVVKLVR